MRGLTGTSGDSAQRGWDGSGLTMAIAADRGSGLAQASSSDLYLYLWAMLSPALPLKEHFILDPLWKETIMLSSSVQSYASRSYRSSTCGIALTFLAAHNLTSDLYPCPHAPPGCCRTCSLKQQSCMNVWPLTVSTGPRCPTSSPSAASQATTRWTSWMRNTRSLSWMALGALSMAVAALTLSKPFPGPFFAQASSQNPPLA